MRKNRFKKSTTPKTPAQLAAIAAKKLKPRETNFTLVVYQKDGVYDCNILRKNQNPSDIAPLKNIASVSNFEIHDISKGKQSYKCQDENGVIFDSRMELVIYKEFMEYEKLGWIKMDTRQEAFGFKQINIPTTYKPDFVFTALSDFKIYSLKKLVIVEKGIQYVCDVKSPLTIKNSTYALKKQLMKGVYNIKVTEIVRALKIP